MSSCTKNRAVQKCGGYLDLFWNEDYYLWIRMAEQNCVMANTGTVLVNVRVELICICGEGENHTFKVKHFFRNICCITNDR